MLGLKILELFCIFLSEPRIMGKCTSCHFFFSYGGFALNNLMNFSIYEAGVISLNYIV